MVDVIDQVVKQLEMVIPRWKEYAEAAGDDTDTSDYYTLCHQKLSVDWNRPTRRSDAV